MQCLITMKSMTYTVRAEVVLKNNGLQAKAVKLDGEDARRGCAHGVRVLCRDRRRIEELLRENRIPYSQIRTE